MDPEPEIPFFKDEGVLNGSPGHVDAVGNTVKPGSPGSPDNLPTAEVILKLQACVENVSCLPRNACT